MNDNGSSVGIILVGIVVILIIIGGVYYLSGHSSGTSAPAGNTTTIGNQGQTGAGVPNGTY